MSTTIKSPPTSALGFGLGLRPTHYEEILQTSPDIDFFEIITENFIDVGGRPLYFLDKIKERYPLVMHGVSMSLGSLDALDFEYLSQVKKLMHYTDAKLVSDHLCWTGVHGKNLHDLIPLPYTDEAVKHVSSRIKAVQEYLECPILIENVSSYVTYKASTMDEWSFIHHIINESDCGLLLDLNNIYVSGFNHGFSPKTYIDALPKGCIKQFHLAGHSHCQTHIIDTHDEPIVNDVWELYEYANSITENVPLIIERDDNIPPLSELIEELNKARKIVSRTCEPA